MAALVFPDRHILQQALASGAIPPELSRLPLRAGYDRRGRLWAIADLPWSREVTKALRRLSVSTAEAPAGVDLQPYRSWAQLIPVQRETTPPPHRTTLLLMPDHLAAEVAAEILRLRRDTEMRIAEAPAESGWPNSMLLHVVDPPEFTLQRLQSRYDTAIFLERGTRVWIEAGWMHSLTHHLTPHDGEWRLFHWKQGWRDWPTPALSMPPAAFPVASPRSGRVRRSADRPLSLPIPLLLKPSAPVATTELWLLQEQPLRQLEEWVARAGETTLSGWEVAVAAPHGRLVVLLRRRATKRQPAELALNGLKLASYLRLPNLFLPCGQTLQPPLRRDQARERLAEDAEHLSLLVPTGSDGTFATVRVRESAFGLLREQCDYEAAAAVSLAPLSLPSTLRLERFLIEPDPIPPVLPLPGRLMNELPPARPPVEPAPGPPIPSRPGLLARLRRLFRTRESEAEPDPGIEVGEAVRTAIPSDALPAAPEFGGRRLKHQERRGALESRFLQLLGPEHSAERRELWPQMAGAHADLGQFTDAAACWLNALWEHDPLPPLWLRGWLQAEKMLSRVPLLEDDLPLLLEMPPSPPMIRTLAACAVWLAHQESPPHVLVANARAIQQRLADHEEWLPVRAAWFAQFGLTRLSRGDVLALARTRDRLLERLYHKGLSLEQDVPSFLRFTGRDVSERFPSVRDWLQRSHESIHRWIDALVLRRPASYIRALPPSYPDRDGRATKAIVDLMLAWGLARLGEATAARHHFQAGRDALSRFDEPEYALLARAFDFRIQQALDAKPVDERWPAALTTDLNQLLAAPLSERQLLTRCRVDVLRGRSRILEPDALFDPYRRPVYAPYQDGIGQMLAELPDLHEDDELGRRVDALWNDFREDRSVLPALVESGLHLAARLGEARSRTFIDRAHQLLDLLPPSATHLLLLEQALAAAAHFRWQDVGQRLAARLLLPRTLDFVSVARSCLEPTAQPELLERLEHWPGRCLRNLRRLDLLAEAQRIWPRLREWVLAPGSLSRLRTVQPDTWLSAVRTLLHLIGEQPGEVNDEVATSTLDLARKQLLYAPDLDYRDRAGLACSYAAALGRVPVRVAQGRFEELFRDMTNLHDRSVANSHLALSPLRFVDAVVRAIVSEDFALSPAVRRWLADDDFRVRRRMQKDLESVRALQGI